MNPFLIIALGAVAYWIGQEVLRRRDVAAPGSVALPPADADAASSPAGAQNLAAWQALDFDADLFPASAARETIAPPATEGAISIAPGCVAIAVGHGFWRRLQQAAAVSPGATPYDKLRQIRATLLAPVAHCIDDRTPAGQSFLAEVTKRVVTRRFRPEDQDAGPLHTGTWIPNGSRTRNGLMRILSGRDHW